MKPETVQAKNKRRMVGLALGLFLVALYLFVYRGGFHSVDEVSMFAVTESLVKFGRFNTDQIAWTQWTTSQAEAQGFFGRDGHVYSKKGLALSLAQAPLYGLALYLPGVGMLQAVSTLNAFITAATGLLIFMFLQRMGFALITSLITALIFGVATIAFVYAKYLFSEPLAGFLLLLAAYMLFVYRQEGGLRHIAIAGLAAGLAIMTRANNLFLLPVFSLYLLWSLANRPPTADHRPPKGIFTSGGVPQLDNDPLETSAGSFITFPPLRTFVLPLIIFVVVVTLVGAILLGYNAIRSGNPFQTGYDLTLFSSNIPLGLYKLLFSPLRGFFIYSPILLLSLPGWWLLRRIYPAEAWLFAGLAGVTIGLFSAWSSGEGLSWGSRFLVPVASFFALCLASIVERVAGSKVAGIHYSLFTFYFLLLLSLLIQLLGVVINPWVFLAQLQTEFGGEFFLEKTAALYDFRYSQIFGQLQAWSVKNSDLAWWQPWGFDGLAFGVSLGLVLLAGWHLWCEATAARELVSSGAGEQRSKEKVSPLLHRTPAPLLLGIILFAAYFLLTRYYSTDQQFGPVADAYTRALNTAAAQAGSGDQLVTVAQYHYHVPMNRFKARLPIIGLAQQDWPPPETALPLLHTALAGPNIWLVTVGFSPASSHNAAERWLTLNAFPASNDWFDDVRLGRFGARPPTLTRTIKVTLGDEVQLVEAKLADSAWSGQTLPVEFTWLPLRRPSADYNIFLQLLTGDGMLAAQHDSSPQGGFTPTSAWQPGQTVVDHHALALAANLPAGTYQLIAGLYNPITGRRLPMPQGGDFVTLGPVMINDPTFNWQGASNAQPSTP